MKALVAVVAIAAPAAAQEQATPPEPRWIATVSSGVLAREGDAARPFAVTGLSRKVGRGYVRVAATAFRSVVRQVDAVLPSSFAIASIGGGGTFGNWFVDGYGSVGRQWYGEVTTAAGTRASLAGSGSAVYGGALSGGRFVALTRRLYLTPSVAVQYGANKALRSSFGPTGPRDEEVDQRVWIGSATVRLDRFFGPESRHIAGVSLSRVATGNGATVMATGVPGGAATAVGVADGWWVSGASASVRVAPRLWLDGAATRTLAARSGDYAVASLGVRLGF